VGASLIAWKRRRDLELLSVALHVNRHDEASRYDCDVYK
jgi:hypothetical protein